MPECDHGDEAAEESGECSAEEISPPTPSEEVDIPPLPAAQPETDTLRIEPRVSPLANLYLREPLVLIALTALLDYLLYMGAGGLSYAIAFLVVPVALLVFAPSRHSSLPVAFLVAAQVLLALRFVWHVDASGIAVAACVLFAFAATLGTGGAVVLMWALSVVPTCVLGPFRWFQYAGGFRRREGVLTRNVRADHVSMVAIPVLVVAAFALVFLLSNPILRNHTQHLADYLQEHLSKLWELLRLTPERVLFWGVCLSVLAALFRPLLVKPAWHHRFLEDEIPTDGGESGLTSQYWVALNSLAALNVLFVLYNGFDAYHLVVRAALPPGYNHSQYAHQGALWLTVALAMSTFVLGGIFRGGLNVHPKRGRLLAFAGIWIVQNYVLAAWVYLRLHMYISYNGLTRMRIVAIYGTTLVLIGFVLVTIKVLRGKTLFWLVRRELAALVVAVVVLALTPIHLVTWRWNVPLICSMETPRPAVQLIEQPIPPEGLMMLPPLLDHPDPVIARGVAAILGQWYFVEAPRYLSAQPNADTPRWTTYQLSHAVCARRLEPYGQRILELVPERNWSEHINRLRAHTSRWI